MRGKGILAWIIGVIMVSTLISGCSQQVGERNDGGAKEEEMTRDMEVAGETIEVTTSEDGAYSVTITEANLMQGEELAKEVPEVVTAEEANVATETSVADEMTRDAAELEGEPKDKSESGDASLTDESVKAASDDKAADERTESSEVSGEAQTVGQEPETDSKKEAEAVARGDEAESTKDEKAESDKSDEAQSEDADKTQSNNEVDQNDKNEAEPVEWSIASVKREDVVVAYNAPVAEADDAESAYQTFDAEVTDFSNDNGTIKLSFKANVPGETQSWTYTVRFAGSKYYAIVQTSPAPNEVTIDNVDYEAQIAELEKYDPSFTEADISLPEGTYIEDGQVVVTEDASGLVQDILVGSGSAEQEMSRADDGNNGNADEGSDSATLQYVKECNERKIKYDNYDALASYSPEILSEIDPKAGEVAELGANAYRIFKGFYTNNWSSGIEGTLGVLKMFGLFKGAGSRGVSNEQILSEVQKVGIEVSDMHGLTKAMNGKLDETLRQAYVNNLQPFDNAVNSLHINAEIIQSIMTEAAIRAAERGIEAPAEDADSEEEFEYNYQLVTLIEELEAAGGRKNSAFKGYAESIKSLTKDFVLVAGEVAKPEETNPIRSYDKYWNLHFNFESEGYYLRKAYRSNILFELKRAFGLMEIHYNIFDPYSKNSHIEYNNQLFDALDRLEQMDAGTSPKEIKAARKSRKSFRLYCPTFDCYVKDLNAAYNAKGYNVATGLLEEYITKLHGRSVTDDLNLAGLWVNDVMVAMKDQSGVLIGIGPKWWGADYMYTNQAHGIGFNCNYKDNWYSADIIGYDGELHKGTKTAYKDKSKSLSGPFDAPKLNPENMPYLIFQLG